MKEDLIKLKELVEKIVINFDIDNLNLRDMRGYDLEVSSEYYTYDWFGNKGKKRVGIDTVITIEKNESKITMPLEEFIDKYVEEKKGE